MNKVIYIDANNKEIPCEAFYFDGSKMIPTEVYYKATDSYTKEIVYDESKNTFKGR